MDIIKLILLELIHSKPISIIAIPARQPSLPSVCQSVWPVNAPTQRGASPDEVVTPPLVANRHLPNQFYAAFQAFLHLEFFMYGIFSAFSWNVHSLFSAKYKGNTICVCICTQFGFYQ